MFGPGWIIHALASPVLVACRRCRASGVWFTANMQASLEQLHMFSNGAAMAMPEPSTLYAQGDTGHADAGAEYTTFRLATPNLFRLNMPNDACPVRAHLN